MTGEVRQPTALDLHKRARSFHKAAERTAWDRYACTTLANLDPAIECEQAASIAAQQADALLKERRKRFPGPKLNEQEESES